MLNASASSVRLCAVTQRTCSSYLRECPTSHPMYSGMLELKKNKSSGVNAECKGCGLTPRDQEDTFSRNSTTSTPFGSFI